MISPLPSAGNSTGPRIAAALVCVLLTAATTRLHAQADDSAARLFRAARTEALGGAADSAEANFRLAATRAGTSGDKATQVAALRALADLQSLKAPCTDSAERTLRTALRAADPTDRSAADALVRVLAARGKADEARRVLVAAYADVQNLGRAITRESVQYLQGQAAIEQAGGHEAAALSALTQALTIAARLRQGGVGDTVAMPTGEVDPVNAWVLFDLAELRLGAKSSSVRQPAAGASILTKLSEAPASTFDESDSQPYPVTRLGDLRLLAARPKGAVTPLRRGC